MSHEVDFVGAGLSQDAINERIETRRSLCRSLGGGEGGSPFERKQVVDPAIPWTKIIGLIESSVPATVASGSMLTTSTTIRANIPINLVLFTT
jgi:hypothetical protein